MSPVVIDELDSAVEPEPTRSADERSEAAPQKTEQPRWRDELNRLRQREARLRAD